MKITPAIMLCSQRWRTLYPESIPTLVKLALNDWRLLTLNLAILKQAYNWDIWKIESQPMRFLTTPQGD